MIAWPRISFRARCSARRFHGCTRARTACHRQPRSAPRPGCAAAQCCCRTAFRWPLIRPLPFLRELPVLPLRTRRTLIPGTAWPIRPIQIHPHQPRPVSPLVLRPKQPLNPGDEGVQAANHSPGIRPPLPDSDHSIGVWFVFAGSLIIIFFSRLSLDHRVQRR